MLKPSFNLLDESLDDLKIEENIIKVLNGHNIYKIGELWQLSRLSLKV